MANQFTPTYVALKNLKKAMRKNPSFSSQLMSITRAEKSEEELSAFSTVCIIDNDWIDMVEKKMQFLIGAVEEERQFVKSEGDVLPIERVRSVGKDSIVDLAKHSNYLTHTPTSTMGKVIPDKLLVSRKESDYSVYENRFLYTALVYISEFLELRLNEIMAITGRYNAQSIFNKKVVTSNSTIEFELRLKEARNKTGGSDAGESAEAVRRLTEALSTTRLLLSTPLMKAVSASPMVRIPVTKTNVIKFDTNFRETLALFEYLHSYTGKGYRTEEKKVYISPFLKTTAEEEFAMLLHLDSFITYTYATGMDREFIALEKEEEEKAEKAKAEALEREIARVKRELNGASEGVEKYILMLEENRANLEKEIQDKNIEITTLKQARDENVRRLSRQFDYDLEQHEKMFTDRLEAADRLKEETEKEMEAKKAEFEAMKEKALSELEAAKKEAEESIEKMRIAFEEKEADLKKSIEEKDAEIDELNGRLIARDGGNKDKDYTEKESFEALERQKKAFDRYFNKQWSLTKKRIRREAFSAKEAKEESNDEPIEKEGESE